MADPNLIAPLSQTTPTTPIGSQVQGAGEPSLLVSGTIIGKDANGNFLLRTDNGNLSLQSNLPLTYNSDVVIKLDQGQQPGQATSAKIVSVNGEPIATFTQPGQQENDTVSNSLLTNTTTTSQTLTNTSQTQAPTTENQTTPTNTVRAVVVSAPVAQPQTQTAATQTPALTNGTNVVIRLPQNTPQPQPATQVTVSQTPTQASSQTPTTPTTTPPATTAQAAVTQTNAPETNAVAQTPQPQTPVPLNAAPAPQAPQAPAAQPAQAQAQSPANTVDAAVPAPAVKVQQVAIESQTPVAQSTLPQTTPQLASPPPPPVSNPLYSAYIKQTVATLQQSGSQADPVLAAIAVAPSQKANVVQGQVTSVNKDGTVTIQTPSGPVTLEPESAADTAKLSVGQSITIELPETAQSSQQAGASSVPASFAEIASSWDTLKQIINVVNQDASNSSGSQADTNGLLARLPTLGPQFVSSSLSFVSALAGGNVNKILGDDTVNALKNNGRTDLIQKFAAELSTVSDYSSKPGQQGTNWQSSFLPFVYQGELQQARLYVKRDGQNNKKGGGAKAGGVRFVVEVSLSEFGGMQLDGLVRQKQANTIFDLMIRSRNAFSAQDQADITSIYKNAAEQTGFKGTLTFQVTNNFPVKPLEDILLGKDTSITV